MRAINDEETIAEMNRKLEELEDKLIRLQASTAAVEYLIKKGKPLGEALEAIKDELQPKMYRLSKEVADRLKPEQAVGHGDHTGSNPVGGGSIPPRPAKKEIKDGN